ncbi:potassium channel subfamily K member 9-like [Actinia tenebrosa]|uniref:Potassium channel subfamily K member 9-like n=1 Tax=Actinia tenebrosa TaxID=6105 RepID=A0A6P8HCX3_ACTTE|nr:potassium channel subfamily K member 9-like [Actinia tenebrosa]
MSSFRKIVYKIALFSVYMMVFGAIMYAVERTEDDQQVDQHVILQNLFEGIQQKHNMTREEFDNITRVIQQSQMMNKSPWTYGTGIRFAIVTCTTIGYGNITPKTKGGMMLCIIGAIFGIPLTLLILNSIGAMITDGCTTLVQIIEIRLLKRTSVQSIEIKRLVSIIVLKNLMVVIGAALLTQVTSWSFIEATYFWFITFTTIGFGDFVPPELVAKKDAIAMAIGSILFTLVGLAALASVINCALAIEIPKDGFCCSLRATQVENTKKACQSREKDNECIT